MTRHYAGSHGPQPYTRRVRALLLANKLAWLATPYVALACATGLTLWAVVTRKPEVRDVYGDSGVA